MKGKFIVLYGINNLGKTTQAKLLVERFLEIGERCEYIKFPVYNLEPSGSLINNYLRENNTCQMPSGALQVVYTLNRTQFQKELEDKLNQGINIIAEDYTGTGIAWGMAGGIDKNFLLKVNSHLLKEDLAFLFDGERFLESKEANHKHEGNDELIEKSRKAHLELGRDFNWIKINANLKIEDINNLLWDKIISRC